MFTQMFYDLLTLVGIIILLGIGIISVTAVMAIVVITVNAVKSALHENKEETKHE